MPNYTAQPSENFNQLPMNCCPENIRSINANQIWLKLTDLRPKWVSQSVSVQVTPQFIDSLFAPLPPYNPSNDRLIAAFFENVIRVLENNPGLGELDEGSVEVCCVEMKALNDSIDLWIGVRRTAGGEVFICCEDDWEPHPHV